MFFLVLFVLGLACQSGDRDNDGDSEGPCEAPLSEFCDGDCPSITEVVERCSSPHGEPPRYECEDLTVVYCMGGLGGWVYYFDSAGDIVGDLIAAYEASDTPDYCQTSASDGSYDIWYGDIPPSECWP